MTKRLNWYYWLARWLWGGGIKNKRATIVGKEPIDAHLGEREKTKQNKNFANVRGRFLSLKKKVWKSTSILKRRRVCVCPSVCVCVGRGGGGGGLTVTDASMRKELYFYIPGGRLDDVYSILNVPYWRGGGWGWGGEACDARIKIQGNRGTGRKFLQTRYVEGHTAHFSPHRGFFFPLSTCLSAVTSERLSIKAGSADLRGEHKETTEGASSRKEVPWER